jgi:CO/xanthine dehydrogenase FAD-binding subunit
MALFYRKLPRFQYLFPDTLENALSVLATHKGAAKVLAGGTDLIPQLKRREIVAPGYVVDLKGIPGLDALTYNEQKGLIIGPLATMSTIEQSTVVREHVPILAQTASTMASPQVRNRGTFAGNICSAVPSADSAPALLASDASLLLKGPRGERIVPIDQFFAGPRETVLHPDEMLLEISVPKPLPMTRAVYLKHSPRHSMDLAIVGVAAAGMCENGACTHIRVALGAVAPTPIRARKAEAIVIGQRPSSGIIEEAARAASTECSPIDDHRASAQYRCDMVYILTRRALTQILLP